MTRSASWVATAGATALIIGWTGTAQALTQAEQTAVSPAPAASAPAPTREVAGSDIVVTAQRRSERLRDVPLSITAVSGEALTRAGVVGTADLNKVTPGFFLYMNGGFAQPVIRGVSSGSSSPGDNSNVAIYVDGVYQAAQVGQLFDLPDVERVEVLKGPQGTLFGRNAAGGAVRVITLEPSLTVPKGQFSASYGSRNQVEFKGFVTAPIAPTLAFSLSGLYAHNDGWDHDILKDKRTGSIDSKMVRGKLLFEPDPKLKITAIGFYQKRNDHSVFSGNAGPQAITIGYQPPGSPLNPSLYEPYKPYDVAVNGPVGTIIQSYGGSLNASYDSGIGTITSVTAYQAGKGIQHSDADFSPVPVAFYNEISKNHAFSEEVNLSSRQFGPLSFTTGAFYFRSREGYDPNYIQAGGDIPPLLTLYGTLRTTAAAVFGEAYLNLFDHFQLIGGLRYSYEKKWSYANFAGDPHDETLQGKASFNSVTPRISLKYSPNSRINIYYTYSQGFKSGGFDPLTSGSVPVRPEKNTQNEVGIKAKVGRSLDFSAAGFYTKYKNIQVQTLIRCAPPGDPAYDPNCIPTARLENAAAGTIYGAELNIDWHLTHDLTLSGGATWLHGKYDKYTDGTITIATPVLDASGHPVYGANGLPILLPASGVADLSGNSIYRTPKFSGNISGNWTHDFTFGTLSANVNVFHTSSWFVDAYNLVKQKAYTTVDAQLSYQPPGTKLRFSLWGRNLSDTTYVESFLIAGNGFGQSYAEPRSVGVRADYAF